MIHFHIPILKVCVCLLFYITLRLTVMLHNSCSRIHSNRFIHHNLNSSNVGYSDLHVIAHLSHTTTTRPQRLLTYFYSTSYTVYVLHRLTYLQHIMLMTTDSISLQSNESNVRQEAQLLLGDRATRKHAKDS